MLCIKRCSKCPGQADPELGPILCDNLPEDCLFKPSDPPHIFYMSIGPYRTSHKVMCPACGHISPYEALPFNVPVYCVICGFDMIIKATKSHLL